MGAQNASSKLIVDMIEGYKEKQTRKVSVFLGRLISVFIKFKHGDRIEIWEQIKSRHRCFSSHTKQVAVLHWEICFANFTYTSTIFRRYIES